MIKEIERMIQEDPYLYLGDTPYAVMLAEVEADGVTFVAFDVYDEVVAVAVIGSNVISDAEDAVELLCETITSALETSFQEDGRTVYALT